jgi:hypothetical protein
LPLCLTPPCSTAKSAFTGNIAFPSDVEIWGTKGSSPQPDSNQRSQNATDILRTRPYRTQKCMRTRLNGHAETGKNPLHLWKSCQETIARNGSQRKRSQENGSQKMIARNTARKRIPARDWK